MLRSQPSSADSFSDAVPLSGSPLSAIEQEVRHCFIHEDAPEYVEALEIGILQVCQSGTVQDWKALLRAAHTLKGGAGLAQLMGLSRLSHRLEDLLLAVREQRVPDLAQAHAVLLQGIDEVRRLLAIAAAESTMDPSSDLLDVLDQILQGTHAPTEDGVSQDAIEIAGGVDPVKLVLDSDFRQLLDIAQGDLAQKPPTEVLGALAESAQMLAEVLNLGWLKHCVAEIQARLFSPAATVQQAKTVLSYLESACDCVLQDQIPETFDWSWNGASARPTDGEMAAMPEPSSSPESNPQAQALSQPGLPQPGLPQPGLLQPVSIAPTSLSSAPVAQDITLRVPVRCLNRLNDRLGEMFVSYETLKLEHRRLGRSNQELRRRSRQFYQVREQLQTLYDQLLLPLAASQPVLGSARIEIPSVEPPQGDTLEFDALEFDALEMDQFSETHSLLQDFQELLTRLEESSDDISLFSKGAEEAMLQLQEQMNGLRTDLRATRMRPFSILAERFRRPLWDFSQRFGKPVELVVGGGEILIDRAVLDQLHDPLMHLLRNAFDHGIEAPEVRAARDKPDLATIRLSARQTGTQISIDLQDDGGGIDLDQVYAKAQAGGLLGAERPSDDVLLSCLFKSGFSTAAQAGELSGRGVGMDAVEAQVSQLRGTVTVKTTLGQGTCFTLQIPRSINILPLLVCQSRRDRGMPAVAAIPSIQILDFLPLSSLLSVLIEGEQAVNGRGGGFDSRALPPSLPWRGQTIPLVALDSLIPLSPTALQLGRGALETSVASGGIGIVVERAGQPLAIAVDQLLCEQELILKTFESWVPLPPYLSGCTILASGEVVPVLRPEALLPDQDTETSVGRQGLNRDVPHAPWPEAVVFSPEEASAPTALVVDDSLTVRRWMVRSLEREGYQVVQCRDGQEAWEQLAGGLQCDVVISDVEMPRLDGFQLLSRIRQTPSLLRLPVALLTSRQGDRHVAKARQLGATGYYTKPLGNQLLLTQLTPLLAGEPTGLLAMVGEASPI